MRAVALLSVFSTVWRASSEITPAGPIDALAFFEASRQSPRPLFILHKRQSCQSGYNSCSSLNAPEACCPNGSACARDSRNNIACCPNNFVCTGVIGGTVSGSQTATTTVATPSATRTSNTNVVIGGTVTVTSTAGVTGTQSGTTAVTSASPASPGTTVANAYYPYTYIATSYANSADCLSAYTACQSQSTACYNSLAGQNGVTISNNMGGGGVTQQAATGLVATSASSICSSLSRSACYGLQPSQCGAFGGGGATGIVQAGRAAGHAFKGPRQTAYVGVGVGIGVGAVVLGMAM